MLGNNDRHHGQITGDFEVKGHHTDICPYATFQLNETQRQENHAEELKTFSQRRNLEIEDIYAKVKKTTPMQRPKPHYGYPNIQDYVSPEHDECTLEIARTDQCLDRPLQNQYADGLCEHVPDLLDHNPESASSNEQSPVLEKVTYLTDAGRNSNVGFVSLRHHHRPSKSFYEAAPVEAPLVYEDGMGLCIPYYKGQIPYLETMDPKQDPQRFHPH